MYIYVTKTTVTLKRRIEDIRSCVRKCEVRLFFCVGSFLRLAIVNIFGEWQKAIEIENATLKEHGTFTVINTPNDCHRLGTRYVFAVKNDKDGKITRFKIFGFQQISFSSREPWLNAFYSRKNSDV